MLNNASLGIAKLIYEQFSKKRRSVSSKKRRKNGVELQSIVKFTLMNDYDFLIKQNV